jgi:autonomous glycyl radical cofactor GrcA
MSEKKSSLGRGAASIFSGVPQPSEVGIQPLKGEDQSAITESQEVYSETQTLKDEKQNVVIQPSSVEPQRLKNEIDTDEIQQSEIDIQKAEEAKLNSESQQSTARDQGLEDVPQSINIETLDQAVEEAMRYPKVTIYSPIIASAMRYREIMTPRFKLSPEAEVRLERVLKREDPILWKAVEEKLSWNKKKNFQRLKAGSQQSTFRGQKLKDESQSIDREVLEQAIEEGSEYPKISIYSPIIAALMRYKEITTPRFKLSPEAEIRLRKVLKNEDPGLWKAIEDKIQWKKRAR